MKRIWLAISVVRVVHKSWCVVCVKDFTYSASGREEQKAAFP